MPISKDKCADRRAMYRELQRTMPGLDGMYRLVHALIAGCDDKTSGVLIVGAGGGRELEELAKGRFDGQITALDPSVPNLDLARDVASDHGSSLDVRFLVGTVDDIPQRERFKIVTSLLVMHHLRDDGAKLAYLKGLLDRLAPGGRLVHADVCFDEIEDFDRLAPIYLAHADIFGVSVDATRLELNAIPNLPIISGTRTRVLFSEAGLTEPFEIFRSLWYRCWTSSRAPK
ncbi:bifunctional 2-polyprenyl-6-hydroxyphenol methylase/3-demethylubiquinol 3-O-methyltransferase UbiG [Sulfitobacter sp. SK011]|uniref:class I SAM-dependent methyltransferase n=1 Tax=Sulfitobacter sp. SK011 TaxID=1389004 RepID=UPI000E0A8468|nr:class I SAM-dependent methyltransferase [Sulfitobacter sp. SK011]AXI42624.1 class I SAM-dependent methyltransferase [Sulfitobacter sp. SK011]